MTQIDHLTIHESDRVRIQDMRDKVRDRFSRGATGLQVTSMMSEYMDQFLRDVLERILQQWPTLERAEMERKHAIVAVGGYGRGELAPYSDLDLLFVLGREDDEGFNQCQSQLVRDLWDAGLKVGQSTHTVADVVQHCLEDPHRATSLIESRLIWGSEPLHHQLRTRFFRRVVHRRMNAFIETCIQEREKECEKHGEVLHSLQPDVKTGQGGLRDVQLIRWIGAAYCGDTDLESLRLQGLLSREDAWSLRDIYNHLTELRLELHLGAGKAQDVLTRDEQLRLAEIHNYTGNRALKPVERFMQNYFLNTQAVMSIKENFIGQFRRPKWWQRVLFAIFAHRAEHIFLVSANTIDVLPSHRSAFLQSLDQMLKLFELAAQYNVKPAPTLLRAIKSSVPHLEQTLSPQGAKSFMEVLHSYQQIGSLVRMMYDCELLFKVIPEFEHVRGLLQFNHYHHFTVDEHTLRAIEAAQSFYEGTSKLNYAYQKMRDREYLHLAILLHDIGKGRVEDHSIIGAEIAQEVGKRLYLPQEKIDQISLLVLKHLRMNDTALRRDISDPKMVVEFSHEIGDGDTLTKLFVLSASDLSAVGPNVWTDWKEELHTSLYVSCLEHFQGSILEENKHQQKAQIMAQIHQSRGWGQLEHAQRVEAEKILALAPDQYIFSTPTESIVDDMRIISQLEQSGVHVDGRFIEKSGTVEYRIIMKQRVFNRIFHTITGVLTARRSEIINADINVHPQGMIFNRFRVIDREFSSSTIQDRIELIAREIRESFERPFSVEKLFKRNRRFSTMEDMQPISGLPTRVVIDNSSSTMCTIIDVFAHDRPGLLYTIAKALEEMDIAVSLAKIATHFDQAVDVFYVTDKEGRKFTDPMLLKLIREQLEKRLDEFSRIGYKLFR